MRNYSEPPPLQDFSGVAFGKTLVLYRAKEQRTLELLRNLALERVVPYLQRISRGQLAREFRRRCVKSAARLKVAKAEATSLADVDAALAAHAELLGPFARLFPVIKLPEIAALRELRRAMEEWVSLEGELVALLARDADEVYEQLAAAVLRAETAAAAGVKCTPAQQELYDRGRKVVDANASAAHCSSEAMLAAADPDVLDPVWCANRPAWVPGCLAGYHGTDPTLPEACPDGYFCPAGLTCAIACPPGASCPRAALSSSLGWSISSTSRRPSSRSVSKPCDVKKPRSVTLPCRQLASDEPARW